MPSQKLELDFKGMVTAPGQLAMAPGALTVAQNVNFPAPGVAEKRRGLTAAANKFTGPCWSVISTKQLGANLLFNTGGASGTSLQYGDGTAAATTLSTPDATNFANTLAARMKGAVVLRNHYLTSARAPARLQSDYSLHWAGMPRAPGMHWTQQNVVQLNAAATWLANQYSVAYRATWVFYDADGVELVGAPSGRWVVSNIGSTAGYTGAARGVTLRVALPQQASTTATNITTSWVMRLYRSVAVDTTVGSTPNDEMQLCYQVSPSAADIAAGYITVTDICPDAALGAYLYTNTVSGGDVSTGMVRAGSTGLGMAASNDLPPIAKDIAVYADCAFYANIQTTQRMTFSILGTGAGALAVGDVLNIGGFNFTGVAGAPAGSNQFRVEVALGSVSANIRQTAMNLVSSINQGTFNIVAAYIGSDASPGTIGSILLEHKRQDLTSFSATTSGVTTAFAPPLAPLNSTCDVWGNGLAISKPFQADAVPPANYIRVGRNDAVIQRIMPLRDALFIFTDDGVHWVRGSSPADFVVEAFDTTFRLLAREACVAVGDAIYAWGREGIARITNGGVEYIDLPIRNYVQACQRGLNAAVGIDTFAQMAFAVAYPVQRRVIFFFPQGSEATGTACSRALVYHIATGAWSTYRFDPADDLTRDAKTCGTVRWSDELLVCGETPYAAGPTSFLYIERNGNALTDYSDISAADGTTATIIKTIFQWNATTVNPAQLNHWSELQVYLSPNIVNTSLTAPASLDVVITSEHGGSMTYTIAPRASDPVNTRLMLTPAVGMATRQTVSVSNNEKDTYVASSGFALLFNPVSPFVVR